MSSAKDHGSCVARSCPCISERVERAEAALALLWKETVLSGNGRANDFGWAKAREATLAVLGDAAFSDEVRVETVFRGGGHR